MYRRVQALTVCYLMQFLKDLYLSSFVVMFLLRYLDEESNTSKYCVCAFKPYILYMTGRTVR